MELALLALKKRCKKPLPQRRRERRGPQRTEKENTLSIFVPCPTPFAYFAYAAHLR